MSDVLSAVLTLFIFLMALLSLCVIAECWWKKLNKEAEDFWDKLLSEEEEDNDGRL